MSSIYTGISGMETNQYGVDLIANNIANANTTGYKDSSADFEAMLSNTLFSGLAGINPMQIGEGVGLGSTEYDMTQGTLQQSSNPLDMAMVGNGYFMVSDGTTQSYTRAGTFNLDANQRLTFGNTGMGVMGWMADSNGNINDTIAPTSNMTIPLGMTDAKATTQATLGGNLSAGSTTPVPMTMTVYDSLGVKHDVTLTYTESATPGQWTVAATSPDGTVTIPTGQEKVTFDQNGKLTSGSITLNMTLTTPNGAAPLSITTDMSNVTQLSGNSTLQSTNQDGLPLGTMQNFSVGTDGTISGVFSNGATKVLGRVAVAHFNNPAGLTQQGNNLWSANASSGGAVVEDATKGGDVIRGGYLEQSNVDLTTEFGNLIIMQRGYQANSKSITTGDEMLQTVLQLKQ